MLTVASILAAMTIAGAFWVGVLAARRLRDWGEGRRALEEGGPAPLAIAAATGAPPDDPRSRRIRELVAERLRHQRGSIASSRPAHQNSTRGDVELQSLRVADVVVVDAGEADVDGDFLVEGICSLREGGVSTAVVSLGDGARKRWLVGGSDREAWMLLTPVLDHGLSGEPPRHIRRARGDFTLSRRGQASAASIGRAGRPDLPRVATYVYAASARDVLWVERWGSDVLMGEGIVVDPALVTFLPGS